MYYVYTILHRCIVYDCAMFISCSPKAKQNAAPPYENITHMDRFEYTYFKYVLDKCIIYNCAKFMSPTVKAKCSAPL